MDFLFERLKMRLRKGLMGHTCDHGQQNCVVRCSGQRGASAPREKWNFLRLVGSGLDNVKSGAQKHPQGTRKCLLPFSVQGVFNTHSNRDV